MEGSAALAVRGDGVDQRVVIGAANLKGHVGDALLLVPGHHLDQLEVASGRIVEGEVLRVVRVDLHRLNLPSRVDGVAGEGLNFLHNHRSGDGHPDFAVLVGLEDALAGQMAIVCVHIAAIGVGQLKLNPGQRLFGHGVQLADDEGARTLIPEDQLRGLLAGFDGDGLGFAVEHEALHRGDLLGGDGGPRLQVGDHDFALGVGIKCAVPSADGSAEAVRQLEAHPGQGFPVGAGDVLFDGERHFAVVFHDNIITAAHVGAGIAAGSGYGAAGAAGKGVGAVLHGDDLGRGVQNVAVRRLGFHHLNGAAGDQPGDGGSTIIPGGAAGQDSAIAVFNDKLSVGDRLPGDRVQLGDGERAQGLVEERQRLSVQGVDGDGLGLGAAVDHIAGGRFDLLGYHGAGDTLDADLAFVVCGVQAVAGQVAVVIINVPAVGVGELELSAGNECAGHRIFFLNDEGPCALIPKGQGLRLTADNLDVLGSAVWHTHLKTPSRTAPHLPC